MTVQELNDFIRFYLGDIDETVIKDTNLNIIIQSVLTQGIAQNDCQEKYYSTKAVLEWLIRADAKGSSGSVGSGDVKLREEEIGKRRIRVEYDVGTSKGTNSSWSSVLEELIDNPTSLYCNPFPVTETDPENANTGAVRIGVTKERFSTAAPWRCSAGGSTPSILSDL